MTESASKLDLGGSGDTRGDEGIASIKFQQRLIHRVINSLDSLGFLYDAFVAMAKLLSLKWLENKKKSLHSVFHFLYSNETAILTIHHEVILIPH